MPPNDAGGDGGDGQRGGRGDGSDTEGAGDGERAASTRTPGLSRRSYLKLVAATGAIAGTGVSMTRPDPLDDAYELSTYWSGPEDARPEDAPVGVRYYATDTNRVFVSTGDRWHWLSLSVPSLDAARIAGVADWVVTTTRELEAAFEGLEPGDTVVVAPGTYRPSSWLRIDVDDVTVRGASRRDTLVKPADGANVGGFHVGGRRRVENVRISGVGFHGNQSTMDPEVKRCHGFLVDDAEDVAVEDCFATRTHPYHEHDAGGSGFCVRESASMVSLVGNRVDDIGDRGIQVAGSDVLVARNRFSNGYDRCISLEVRQPDGYKHYARDVSVVNNLGRDNGSGSVVGASQGPKGRPGPGNVAIVGNVAAGTHRRTVYLGVEARMENVAIVGNAGRQADYHEERSGIYVAGEVSNLTVVGNALADYSLHGIELVGDGTGVVCSNNAVARPARHGIVLDCDDAVLTGNRVAEPGGHGIVVDSSDASLTGNAVTAPAGTGIAVGDGVRRVAVVGNRVANAARAVSIDGRDCVVAGTVAPDGALSEGDHADRNTVFGNRVRSREVRGPETVVVGGEERHSVAAEGGTASVEFDRPRTRKPSLDVHSDDAALWSASWTRRGGDYVGVTLSFVGPGGGAVPTEAIVTVRD